MNMTEFWKERFKDLNARRARALAVKHFRPHCAVKFAAEVFPNVKLAPWQKRLLCKFEQRPVTAFHPIAKRRAKPFANSEDMSIVEHSAGVARGIFPRLIIIDELSRTDVWK